MSPTRHLNSTDSQSDSEESKTDLILPDDLPIDLRVKIVVCLIYLRNLHPIKVNFFLHFWHRICCNTFSRFLLQKPR